MRSKKSLLKISKEIRASAFETILNANSGHLGACSSSVELMTGLYFGGGLNFNPKNPYDEDRDRVYVRGHVGPLRYKIFSMLGWIDEKELNTYRQFGSRLKGHENMNYCPGVDLTPSGSLGMGLSYGVGSAIITKEQGKNCRHIVFLGDGEEQEGSVSEAARHATSLGLDNLICILDKNSKQLSRPTFESDGGSDVRKIWEGYGWDTYEIKDGHDFENIIPVYNKLKNITKPTFVIAHTEKAKCLRGGKEHFNGYHTISSCKDKGIIQVAINDLRKGIQQEKKATTSFERPQEILSKYPVNIKVNLKNNTNLDHAQIDFFRGIEKIVNETRMPFYFLTPDFLNSDVIPLCKLDKSSTYIDTGIREQHLVAMAYAMSKNKPDARIFINYGDAFLYRAADQLNAAAQGKGRLIFMSEMSGLSQHQNGSTHQSSGQPGVPLFVPGVQFYEPADVQDLFNVLNHGFSDNPGLMFIRSHRADISPLEIDQKERNIENYVAFESMKKPELNLVGSGFVLEGLVNAAKELEIKNRVGSRVINIINMKKFGESFTKKIIQDKPLLTVYNGNPEILQSIVARAIMNEPTTGRPSVIKGHGFYIGETGKLNDLVVHNKLDSKGIINILEENKLIK